MQPAITAVLLLLAFQLPVVGQDKAKVKCGPNDVDRIIFKEAETIHFLGYVRCGEEVEVLDSAKNAYRVRYSGQTGYILPDAIDGRSVSAPVIRAAQESESGNAQQPQSGSKPLTNKDVLDMLDVGLSPEIVVAKIKTSSCIFDTTPTTLKELKTKGVPDSVVLAMVQAPAVPAEGARPEPPSSPNTPSAQPSTQPSSTPSDAAAKQADEKRRQAMQKANDDLEDCRTRAQNEFDTKTNVLGTMAISPMMRVAAANKLKQNLDIEIRACRAQYESRLKSIQ